MRHGVSYCVGDRGYSVLSFDGADLDQVVAWEAWLYADGITEYHVRTKDGVGAIELEDGTLEGAMRRMRAIISASHTTLPE